MPDQLTLQDLQEIHQWVQSQPDRRKAEAEMGVDQLQGPEMEQYLKLGGQAGEEPNGSSWTGGDIAGLVAGLGTAAITGKLAKDFGKFAKGRIVNRMKPDELLKTASAQFVAQGLDPVSADLAAKDVLKQSLANQHSSDVRFDAKTSLLPWLGGALDMAGVSKGGGLMTGLAGKAIPARARAGLRDRRGIQIRHIPEFAKGGIQPASAEGPSGRLLGDISPAPAPKLRAPVAEAPAPVAEAPAPPNASVPQHSGSTGTNTMDMWTRRQPVQNVGGPLETMPPWPSHASRTSFPSSMTARVAADPKEPQVVKEAVSQAIESKVRAAPAKPARVRPEPRYAPEEPASGPARSADEIQRGGPLQDPEKSKAALERVKLRKAKEKKRDDKAHQAALRKSK